jgi:hypothetical protein
MRTFAITLLLVMFVAALPAAKTLDIYRTY